jgi:hypothetical protein
LKPQELTRQNAHGIKLKATMIDGKEWQRSWLISLGAAGGGDRVHKPAKTNSILNGGFGRRKQGKRWVCQKGAFLNACRVSKCILDFALRS